VGAEKIPADIVRRLRSAPFDFPNPVTQSMGGFEIEPRMGMVPSQMMDSSIQTGGRNFSPKI